MRHFGIFPPRFSKVLSTSKYMFGGWMTLVASGLWLLGTACTTAGGGSTTQTVRTIHVVVTGGGCARTQIPGCKVEFHSQKDGSLVAVATTEEHGRADLEVPAGMVGIVNARCVIAPYVTVNLRENSYFIEETPPTDCR